MPLVLRIQRSVISWNTINDITVQSLPDLVYFMPLYMPATLLTANAMSPLRDKSVKTWNMRHAIT
nr:MAG TPA: hypothetical protein [Caudoviricetes sp.]